MKILNLFRRLVAGFASTTVRSRNLWLLALATGLFLTVAVPHASADVPNPFNNSASTSAAGVDQAGNDVVVIFYKIMKVVALILGGLTVWRLIENDYKWALTFFITCVFAWFLPSVVALAEKIGSNAFNRGIGMIMF